MSQVVFDDDSDQEAGQCKLDMLELNGDQAPQRRSLDFSNSSSKDSPFEVCPPQEPLTIRSVV
jgi:hypothetical protein